MLGELTHDLCFGVASLLAGRFAEEHAALKRGAHAEDPLRRLSAREREVLKLVAEGASSKQIASRLGIVPASVDTYRSRLMFKLDVKGVAGLVRFAIRHSVVEP